ncbi:MAG: hypothetical protein H7122_08645 [Chitinophagaceae bacterium]|nr:hypothetical protein [Chitinophagaceae bacterium]
MYKKFKQLSFVIGLFFFIVSLILFVHILFSDSTGKINFYTAIVFFIFGIAMMAARDSEKEKTESKIKNT